jgi:hypothetical protein
MKPTIIDIVSNVVVRDYIQHWWQVATDIVNLNADGKNRYELRREAEKLILNAIKSILKNFDYRNGIHDYDTVETLMCNLWTSVARHLRYCNVDDDDDTWVEYLSQAKKISTSLEDEFTRRLNELIDRNNAS